MLHDGTNLADPVSVRLPDGKAAVTRANVRGRKHRLALLVGLSQFYQLRSAGRCEPLDAPRPVVQTGPPRPWAQANSLPPDRSWLLPPPPAPRRGGGEKLLPRPAGHRFGGPCRGIGERTGRGCDSRTRLAQPVRVSDRRERLSNV